MTKKSRFDGPMTAGEAIERMKRDPEWVAQREARKRWQRAYARKLREKEEPLLRDLARVGCEVDSVWDLVNTREPYPEAVPILLRHLERIDHDPVIREGIARALTIKGFPEILPAMIESFRRDPDTRPNGPKWAKGNAIEVLYDDRYVEEIAELAKDRAHGEVRDMLVYALAKSRTELADETLKELLSDPEVGLHAKPAIERRDRRRSKRKR